MPDPLQTLVLNEITRIHRDGQSGCRCPEEDLVEVPFQELSPGPVGSTFWQIDDLPGPRRTGRRCCGAVVYAEASAVEQGVDI
jgi:hypothetical protein